MVVVDVTMEVVVVLVGVVAEATEETKEGAAVEQVEPVPTEAQTEE